MLADSIRACAQYPYMREMSVNADSIRACAQYPRMRTISAHAHNIRTCVRYRTCAQYPCMCTVQYPRMRTASVHAHSIRARARATCTIQAHVLSICPNALSIRKYTTYLRSSAHDAQLYMSQGSVGDPDPHVFGPPRSGSGSGSGSFPFLINVLSGLKKCLQNKILPQNFSKN
jgi:hypothetical protein